MFPVQSAPSPFMIIFFILYSLYFVPIVASSILLSSFASDIVPTTVLFFNLKSFAYLRSFPSCITAIFISIPFFFLFALFFLKCFTFTFFFPFWCFAFCFFIYIPSCSQNIYSAFLLPSIFPSS